MLGSPESSGYPAYYKAFSIATGAAAGGLGAVAVRNYRLESPSPNKAATPAYLAPSN